MLTGIQLAILVWVGMGLLSFAVDPFTKKSHIKDLTNRKTVTLGFFLKWSILSIILIILGGLTLVTTFFEFLGESEIVDKIAKTVIWKR